MWNTTYDTGRVAAWCRDNGLTYDMSEAGQRTIIIWIYRDGALLRTFLVDNNKINGHDFNHWCQTLGYTLP